MFLLLIIRTQKVAFISWTQEFSDVLKCLFIWIHIYHCISMWYMYLYLIAFGCLCTGDAVLDGVDSNNPTASTTGAGQSACNPLFWFYGFSSCGWYFLCPAGETPSNAKPIWNTGIYHRRVQRVIFCHRCVWTLSAGRPPPNPYPASPAGPVSRKSYFG